jgi:hypothetical protein
MARSGTTERMLARSRIRTRCWCFRQLLTPSCPSGFRQSQTFPIPLDQTAHLNRNPVGDSSGAERCFRYCRFAGRYRKGRVMRFSVDATAKAYTSSSLTKYATKTSVLRTSASAFRARSAHSFATERKSVLWSACRKESATSPQDR